MSQPDYKSYIYISLHWASWYHIDALFLTFLWPNDWSIYNNLKWILLFACHFQSYSSLTKSKKHISYPTMSNMMSSALLSNSTRILINDTRAWDFTKKTTLWWTDSMYCMCRPVHRKAQWTILRRTTDGFSFSDCTDYKLKLCLSYGWAKCLGDVYTESGNTKGLFTLSRELMGEERYRKVAWIVLH